MSDIHEWPKDDTLITSTTSVDFIKPIVPVGWWYVGGYNNFAVTERPTDEQIRNTEELLGWKWKENL